jgi:hypothetical protein
MNRRAPKVTVTRDDKKEGVVVPKLVLPLALSFSNHFVVIFKFAQAALDLDRRRGF